MPMPPRPGGVEMATMVSLGANSRSAETGLGCTADQGASAGGSTELRLGGRGSLGIDDDIAMEAFAAAGGGEIFVGAEGEVEHAAFAGAHGREAVGLAGGAYASGGGFGGEAKFAGADGLELVGVEGDLIVFFGLEADDLGGHVFEGAEEFAAALGEQRRVGAGQLDVDFAGLQAIGVGSAAAGGDSIFEA